MRKVRKNMPRVCSEVPKNSMHWYHLTLWCSLRNIQIILIITELVCNEDSQIIYCSSANKQLQALLYKSCTIFCLILCCSLFSPCSWDVSCHRNVKKVVKSASSVYMFWERSSDKKAGTVFQESAKAGRIGKLTNSNHVLSYICVTEYGTTAHRAVLLWTRVQHPVLLQCFSSN